MKQSPRKMVWLLVVPAGIVAHTVLILALYGGLFGWADGGGAPAWLTLPLTLLLYSLAPLAPLTDWMTPPLPDAAMIPLGFAGSAALWWSLIGWRLGRFGRRSNPRRHP